MKKSDRISTTSINFKCESSHHCRFNCVDWRNWAPSGYTKDSSSYVCAPYDMNDKVCNLSGDDASCGIEEDNLHCAVYKWSSNTDAVSGTAGYRCSTESTNGFCPAFVNGVEIFEERSDDSNIFDAIVSFDSFGFICEYTSSLENGSVCYYDSQCISEWCKINDNSKGICTKKQKYWNHVILMGLIILVIKIVGQHHYIVLNLQKMITSVRILLIHQQELYQNMLKIYQMGMDVSMMDNV